MNNLLYYILLVYLIGFIFNIFCICLAFASDSKEKIFWSAKFILFLIFSIFCSWFIWLYLTYYYTLKNENY